MSKEEVKLYKTMPEKELIKLYKYLLDWKNWFVSKQWREGDDVIIVISPAFYHPYEYEAEPFRIRLTPCPTE
jgi:hypothetical protein